MLNFGKDEYYYNTTRLKRPVLKQLIETLVDSGYVKEGKVSAAEKVITFLNFYAYRYRYRYLRRIY